MNIAKLEAYVRMYPVDVDEYFVEGVRAIMQSVDLDDSERLNLLALYFVARDAETDKHGEECPYCHDLFYSYANDDPLKLHFQYCDSRPEEED